MNRLILIRAAYPAPTAADPPRHRAQRLARATATYYRWWLAHALSSQSWTRLAWQRIQEVAHHTKASPHIAPTAIGAHMDQRLAFLPAAEAKASGS